MAKIIISEEGGLQREIPLSRHRLALGRGAHNDIVIDHVAASLEHAVIVIQQDDFILEDLGSTNGTKVNGQPIKKHFLRNGDHIELATVHLHFSQDEILLQSLGSEESFPLTISGEGIDRGFGGKRRERTYIKVLSGTHAGKEIVLMKSLTTIGKPGKQIAAFAFEGGKYWLIHIEGEAYPKVDGISDNAGLRRLHGGEIIEFAEVKMEFLITN